MDHLPLLMSNMIPYMHYSLHPVALPLLIMTTVKIVWCRHASSPGPEYRILKHDRDFTRLTIIIFAA